MVLAMDPPTAAAQAVEELANRATGPELNLLLAERRVEMPFAQVLRLIADLRPPPDPALA